MENEYLEEKKEKKGKLFGYIFIFWFICSFVAFFLIEDPYYIVMNFGQYFLVFGSVVFFSQENKKDALITIPFMIIGLCCIVIPFLMLHPELLSISLDWNTVIAVLMLLAFLIAGLCTSIIPVIKRKHLEKVCTYEVDATIIGYNTTTSDKGNTLYAPIYSFWYNGQTREIATDFYTNMGVKEPGTKVTLKINPEKPEEFFNEKSKGYLIAVFVGIFISCLILPLIIYVLKNGVVG